MSYLRVWVHLVFSTKNREPYLTKELRGKVISHIIQNCKEKEIYLQAINGFTDHLHCLISLEREQTISNIAKLIKGESSNWINKNNFIKGKFMWQDDYFAVSVSHSQYELVMKYIKNQESHHTKRTFSEEMVEFNIKYGWGKNSI